MEDFAKKIGVWVPLLIAAGYFIFLIATWQKFTVNMKAADERFDQMLKKMYPEQKAGE